MYDPTEGTLVLELVDVVTELTRRQRELLGCLKDFRADFLEGPLALEAYQPPPPRFLQPPAPRSVAPPRPEVTPRPVVAHPPVVAPVPPAPPATADPAVRVHRTKRDYDYFAELDDLLAHLPVDPEPQAPDSPPGL